MGNRTDACCCCLLAHDYCLRLLSLSTTPFLLETTTTDLGTNQLGLMLNPHFDSRSVAYRNLDVCIQHLYLQ